ncbi:actin cytoskeleton organization protein (Cro1), putative [Cordyceps militaris CM01]|uniref:Actin cytoskeleton organization protein (Cro1), putative n=1 Tax=Cordyceps militaris (strain CM01) TaxID=983644 RepID=G3J9Y6_CORMM|nr:actin cytoskeleton organization protein (Cro1), putative [Cordyceps militaris CM01]EGX94209.1 actin cytoskeleton organization protein (Cro1), putative [Cordyceps militaris CM01]
MATAAETIQASGPAASVQDQTLLVFARLMEGGQEDEETCRDLDLLTKMLDDDAAARAADPAHHRSICRVIDSDCVDTILCYLDMRQPDLVRGHAVLTTSAYMRAAADDASDKLRAFFLDRIQRRTYDDYIVAFCVAAAAFPIVPDLTTEMFLNEGFLSSLGPLIRREWKSRKVETACLEMLNAACMDGRCREAIQKYCVDWLEEIVEQYTMDMGKRLSEDPNLQGEEGSVSMRQHSEQVQYLAAVILAKLRAVPKPSGPNAPRVESAVTSLFDLAGLFIKMIVRNEDHGKQHAIEGLAYASLQPQIKKVIVSNDLLLKKLLETLSSAPPRSPTTYGALSIFQNLTRYRPPFTEDEKKMSQLQAYANAEGKLPAMDPLDDDEHVEKRCAAVFAAGITPVLVAHGKHDSAAALGIIANILLSLTSIKSIRGQLAQQGAVPLLLIAWNSLKEEQGDARRSAAQALSRILISINPALVFGGTRANPIDAAIAPLISILPTDPASDRRDLLPTFEALMALTNLASMEGDTGIAHQIIRHAWSHIEEQLLASNRLVAKAAVELVCNLTQSPDGIALYADGSAHAAQRLHILLALADAEDEGTRSAAGGALAALTAYEQVVRAVVHRKRGVAVLLGLCVDDSDDLRHRGAASILNMVLAKGVIGSDARDKIREEGGVDILKTCLKKSRRPEVVQAAVQALKPLVEKQLTEVTEVD